MKLKLDLTTETLSYRFGITENFAHDIIEDTLSNMACMLKFLIRWPFEEELKPPDIGLLTSSRKKHKSCIIIDSIEFPIGRTSSWSC